MLKRSVKEEKEYLIFTVKAKKASAINLKLVHWTSEDEAGFLEECWKGSDHGFLTQV